MLWGFYIQFSVCCGQRFELVASEKSHGVSDNLNISNMLEIFVEYFLRVGTLSALLCVRRNKCVKAPTEGQVRSQLLVFWRR